MSTTAGGRRLRRARQPRLDTHWWWSLGFTVTLVGLVAAAIGADWMLTLGIVGISAVGLGFFHFLFPGGAHFGLTLANFLAFYACLFEFFREANFTAVPTDLTMLARALPVLGFLAGCIVHRKRVHMLIHARRVRDLDLNHLPRLLRWFLPTLMIGMASFALPGLAMDSTVASIALISAMGLVTLSAAFAVRDVVTLMVDVSLVFKAVGARLERLVMPMLAFVTFYSLLVVVFTCLYRIADLTTPAPQFQMHGAAARIGFVDALYYSVATITTLGFGDIAPVSLLVRALTAIEVVCGILMLLFGFSEIMRGAGPDSDPMHHREDD